MRDALYTAESLIRSALNRSIWARPVDISLIYILSGLFWVLVEPWGLSSCGDMTQSTKLRHLEAFISIYFVGWILCFVANYGCGGWFVLLFHSWKPSHLSTIKMCTHRVKSTLTLSEALTMTGVHVPPHNRGFTILGCFATLCERWPDTDSTDKNSH